MKNPFVKENNTGLIAAALAGSILAGALTYLFLTDSGASVRGNLKKKAKRKAKDLASAAVSKKTGLPRRAVKALTDHAVK